MAGDLGMLLQQQGCRYHHDPPPHPTPSPCCPPEGPRHGASPVPAPHLCPSTDSGLRVPLCARAALAPDSARGGHRQPGPGQRAGTAPRVKPAVPGRRLTAVPGVLLGKGSPGAGECLCLGLSRSSTAARPLLLARMDYAKSLSLRLAAPVSKCVSASASMTQQLLSSPAPRPRPYRVCNWDRSLRKGIMAQSLAELLRQAQSALLAPDPISLVLDEDGTAVETEAFFQTLEEGTVLMVLGKGQTWAPSKTPGYQLSLSRKPPRRIDVACVTFDLYKTNPRDLGCLNVKATLYGTYSMSYDLRCYGAKRLVKEALRWTLFTMQATGHILLGTSCYMQQLLDATEDAKEVESSRALPSLLPRSLPPLPRRKALQ